MNKSNGIFRCSNGCNSINEKTFTRERNLKGVDENSPLTLLIISRCSSCLKYSTNYSEGVVPYKHYCFDVIQQALNGYSVEACERTIGYWKAWVKDMLSSICQKIAKLYKYKLSEPFIHLKLQEYIKTNKEDWLRLILDLFYTPFNSFCASDKISNIHCSHSQLTVSKKAINLLKKEEKKDPG